jgi:hypothetical protein
MGCKVGKCPPIDDVEHELPVRVGVLPLTLKTGNRVPDPQMRKAIPIPAYVSEYKR